MSRWSAASLTASIVLSLPLLFAPSLAAQSFTLEQVMSAPFNSGLEASREGEAHSCGLPMSRAGAISGLPTWRMARRGGLPATWLTMAWRSAARIGRLTASRLCMCTAGTRSFRIWGRPIPALIPGGYGRGDRSRGCGRCGRKGYGQSCGYGAPQAGCRASEPALSPDGSYAGFSA